MAVPSTKGASAPIASEGLVTTYELENLTFTAGRPDEGVVYAFEESATVKDASLFAVAPKAGLAVRLDLDRECKLDRDSLEQLVSRIKEVADRPDLGPRVGETERSYPLKDAVENKKAKNPRDSRIWEPVASDGGSDGGAQLGIFIRKSDFGAPLDLWAVCISSVGRNVYTEFVDMYVTPVLGKTTFKELVGSRPYKQLLKATRRNANHMLSDFLIELALIRSVQFGTDDRSMSTLDEIHSPMIKNLEVDCMWNVFARMDDKTVGYYSEVVPRKRCHGRATLRILHPVQGIALFGFEKKPSERDPSGGHAVTPRRVEASASEKFDHDKVNRSYVAASTARTVAEWATQQNFAAVNPRSLKAPAAASASVHILEPLQVLVV